METGFVRVLTWRGVPVLAHWSTLAFAVASVTAGRRSVGGTLGVWLLILAHEYGHAWMCRRFRVRVCEIRVLPFAGECVHEATSSMRARVAIAWGGVLAQLVLFVAALVLVGFNPFRIGPTNLLGVFLGPNLGMIVLNLLPIPPLDGYTAWRLAYLVRDRTPRFDRSHET